MPSCITHAVVSVGAGKAFAPEGVPRDFWTVALACSLLPDADVLYVILPVPQEYFDLLGHRGFSHSLTFALFVGALAPFALSERVRSARRWWSYFLFFSPLIASHGILDAFTDGGNGIALLSPFSTERVFFPWTPIAVSMISYRDLFSRDGFETMKSEFIWVWLPLLVLVAAMAMLRRSRRTGGTPPS